MQELPQFRYELTHDPSPTYLLVEYRVFSPHQERSGGSLAEQPEWLTNIAHLACVAGANLAEPPNILCWFTAKDEELVEFKFFQRDKVQS